MLCARMIDPRFALKQELGNRNDPVTRPLIVFKNLRQRLQDILGIVMEEHDIARDSRSSCIA